MSQVTTLLLTTAFAATCNAADSKTSDCSVRVHVSDADGRPVDDLPVLLQMDSGGPLRKTVTTRGIAEFCDVGWGAFSVTAGRDLCGQVIVRDLYIRWTRTLDVPVIYENCHGMTIINACLVMLRFLDQEGNPVSGVRVEPGVPRPTSSDRYGRAVIALDFGTIANVGVSKTGYEPHTVQIQCERDHPEIEQRIGLRHSK